MSKYREMLKRFETEIRRDGLLLEEDTSDPTFIFHIELPGGVEGTYRVLALQEDIFNLLRIARAVSPSNLDGVHNALLSCIARTSDLHEEKAVVEWKASVEAPTRKQKNLQQWVEEEIPNARVFLGSLFLSNR